MDASKEVASQKQLGPAVVRIELSQANQLTPISVEPTSTNPQHLRCDSTVGPAFSFQESEENRVCSCLESSSDGFPCPLSTPMEWRETNNVAQQHQPLEEIVNHFQETSRRDLSGGLSTNSVFDMARGLVLLKPVYQPDCNTRLEWTNAPQDKWLFCQEPPAVHPVGGYL